MISLEYRLEAESFLLSVFMSVLASILISSLCLQVMFQDDTTMMDVIGSLENSPNKAEPTRHREYLSTVSSFKQVIPFTNEEILSKIHETYK